MPRTKRVRTLADGRRIEITSNNGVRKRCACKRKNWVSCSHPWHFSFKVRGGRHWRFRIDEYKDLLGGPISTKDEALTAADKLRALIRAGQFPPTPAPAPATPADLTFETLAETWMSTERKRCSPNQQTNDKGIMRKLGVVEIDGVPLARRPIGLITVTDLEKAFDGLGPLAASSRNKYLQAIKSLEAWALDTGHLTRKWLVGRAVRKGGAMARRKGARRERRLAPDVLDANGTITQPGEERRLRAVAGPYLQRLIIAALETCCRAGELLTLQWADVSLTRKQITIRAEKAKTRTTRHIPISPTLRGVLELLQHDPKGDPHPPTAFVFGNPTGDQVAFPKKAWETAVLRAHGYQPKWSKGGKLSAESREALRTIDLHFHDLRHEAGSRLAERGWPLHQVQEVLGHADLKQTSTYLNATVQDLHASMERFGTGSTDHSLHDVARGPSTAPPPSGNADSTDTRKPLVN
jgi:integrase